MNTIGNYIDALSICNIKIFMLEDIKRNATSSDFEIAEATKKTNILNSQRNFIIDEIDLAINKIATGKQQKIFGSNKMYGK